MIRARWSATVLELAVVTVTAAAGEDASLSMFRNSGFEAGLDGWSFSKGWSKMDEATRGRAVEVRTDGAKSGRSYLRVTNHGKRDFYGVQQGVQFEADTVYKISWWVRGRAQSTGHEKGGTRLRIWGYGGPEYTGDTSYDAGEWTYHEHTIHSTRRARGGVALWVWPDGHCDIDDLAIRKAFWRTNKEHNATAPGEPIGLVFEMSRGDGARARVTYRILDSNRKVVREERFEGVPPLSKEVVFESDTTGFYRLESRVKTRGGELEDTLGICVLARAGGLAGVRAFWQTADRR